MEYIYRKISESILTNLKIKFRFRKLFICNELTFPQFLLIHSLVAAPSFMVTLIVISQPLKNSRVMKTIETS